MSSKLSGNGPGWRIPGSSRIRALLTIGLISLSCFGCVTPPHPPSFHPIYPPRPLLQMLPQRAAVQGHDYSIMLWDDWLLLGGYVVELERQLTAACLALGGTPTDCHAEAVK